MQALGSWGDGGLKIFRGCADDTPPPPNNKYIK